jgi:hypothetical protein
MVITTERYEELDQFVKGYIKLCKHYSVVMEYLGDSLVLSTLEDDVSIKCFESELKDQEDKMRLYLDHYQIDNKEEDNV